MSYTYPKTRLVPARRVNPAFVVGSKTMESIQIRSFRKIAKTKAAIAVVICALAGCVPVVNAYPPYPDIWEWQSAFYSQGPVNLDFRPMTDGDVLIKASVLVEREVEPYFRDEHVAFFSRHRLGSAAEVFAGELPPPVEPYRLKVPSDKSLVAIGSNECSRGLGAGLYLQNAKGKKVAGTSFILLLDQPKSYPAVTCEEQLHPGFVAAVTVLQPQGLLRLHDGTALLGTSHGLVVRVRIRGEGRVCTESRLVGNQLFLVEPDWVERRFRDFRTALQTNEMDWPAFFNLLRKDLLGSREMVGTCSSVPDHKN